jgi:hypothetical protein
MSIPSHVVVDTFTPILRQRDRIKRIKERLSRASEIQRFQINGELGEAERELARLEVIDAGGAR